MNAEVGLGFRDHTGWAAAVLLGGDPLAPVVIARVRITLSPPDLPGEVHHAAAQLDPESAAALVRAVTDAAADAAAAAVESILSEHCPGSSSARAGVPIGSRAVPMPSAATRRAHSLMHAAEGHLYREALAEGCARAGLTVRRFPRAGLTSLAAEATGLSIGQLTALVNGLGSRLGPPWARDQKDAALCAWLALAKVV